MIYIQLEQVINKYYNLSHKVKNIKKETEKELIKNKEFAKMCGQLARKHQIHFYIALVFK